MSDDYSTRNYYLAFSHFQKIGPVRLKRLENFFPDLAEAFRAPGAYLEKAGLEPALVSEFITWRSSFSLSRALSELEREKIAFVTWQEENYPRLLRELYDPPPILYYKGNWSLAIRRAGCYLAVVGSREHSPYAVRVVETLLPPISRAGIAIVSGLAHGVDALAHQKALNNQGQTIAVLGSGLSQDRLYPSANRGLAERIISNRGLLLSEFPPQTAPLKQNFPQRNRIISGLAQATLVIESRERSGSLITAACALEQNREVLAVPGEISSEFSLGPNNLIKQGAKVITRAEDILEIFQIGNDCGEDKRQHHPARPT